MKFTPVEDIIVDKFRGQGVSEAQKILITKDGNKITTATIILTFHGSTVPSEINVGFLKVSFPIHPQPSEMFRLPTVWTSQKQLQKSLQMPKMIHG